MDGGVVVVGEVDAGDDPRLAWIAVGEDPYWRLSQTFGRCVVDGDGCRPCVVVGGVSPCTLVRISNSFVVVDVAPDGRRSTWFVWGMVQFQEYRSELVSLGGDVGNGR